MTTKWRAAVAAGFAIVAFAGVAEAQQNIDAGSSAYFGGYSRFGGYYDTFGDNGGFKGYSGWGTYRRVDEGSSSTTATTATIGTVPLPGGDDNGRHCTWLRGKAHATHQRKWRQRYAACMRDFVKN